MRNTPQDAANWQLLQDLFHLVETTPVADRDRVLAENCPDPGLRQRALDIFNASIIDKHQPVPDLVTVASETLTPKP